MGLNRSKEKPKRIEEDLMRAFPYIEFWDFKKYDIEKPKISVANIQIETPGDILKTKPPKLTGDAESKQKQKIYHFVKEAVEKGADLIVLPELSTSKDICEGMKEKFSDSQSIMILGSYYDDDLNCSNVLIDGEFYGQIKNNPSPKERDYMRRSNDISVFINTPIGDFAVLICYDATDFSILAALEGYTDFIICIARTRDVVTFRNIFSALTYLKYQYVIFCNDAQYGGSSFYLPFHGNRALDVLGQKNEGIIYRNFDLEKLDEMRASPKKEEIFKYPPASSKPRHVPHVERGRRMKEYFEAKSFNYLSHVRRFEILKGFLAHVNISQSLSGIGTGSSVYRLDDALLRSCQAMYAPAIAVERAVNLKPIVLKYFLVGLIESFCENVKDLSEKKSEIAKKLANKLKGKQSLLFEIDEEVIKDALLRTPELLDEILRVYYIEKDKKLIEIPNELRIKRNDLKYE